MKDAAFCLPYAARSVLSPWSCQRPSLWLSSSVRTDLGSEALAAMSISTARPATAIEGAAFFHCCDCNPNPLRYRWLSSPPQLWFHFGPSLWLSPNLHLDLG